MKPSLPLQVLSALSIFSPTYVPAVSALELDPTQTSQVKDVAKKVAGELVSMYATKVDGDNVQVIAGVPGILPQPHYWWEAGAMFGTLLDYWYYTNDTTYNNMTWQGMVYQFGENLDLMPSNQSKNEGNDDQLFWAFSVMLAAELNFPAPPGDKPGWLGMAQSVMNQLIGRMQKEIDEGNCGGGLRWQIHQWNKGFDFKNTPSNGGMFQLGARLARYTGNDTYAVWAEKAFDWLLQSPLISDSWQIYDGAAMDKNCTEADHTQWTYNYGIMIGGAAYMYDYTNGSKKWEERIDGMLNHTAYFFPEKTGSVMVEVCEKNQLCDNDQVSFKAYLARWLAVTMKLAPFTRDRIMPLLQHSAKAAAQSCTGPEAGYKCGNRWYWQGFDGNGGVGQQQSALSIISTTLADLAPPIYGAKNGGESKGDPSLGSGPPAVVLPPHSQITTGSKAAAGILTAIVLAGVVGGGIWLVLE